jgi:hypothetical protein
VNKQGQGSTVELEYPFSDLVYGPSGKLFGVTGFIGLVEIGDDGKLTELFKSPNSSSRVIKMALQPDGSFVVGTSDNKLLRARAGEAAVTIPVEGRNICNLATSPLDGSAYVITAEGAAIASMRQARLYRIRPGQDTAELLATDDRFADVHSSGLACDARDRLYFVPRPTIMTEPSIMRYDPVDQSFKTIAGVGGVAFNGAGVDDSLKHPLGLKLDPTGNLLFVDRDRRQVRRIPAEVLE